MDNINHGFAYSPDGRQHVQESTSQNPDDINQSLLHHSVPYSQLMPGMPLSSENISFGGPNQFGSGRFPLGFSQNMTHQGFPHLMSQSQLCQNLELEMSHRQPRPSQSLRHQSHGQSHSGFGVDISPVASPAFPSPSESSRRRGVDHLPSFSSIVASAASSISTMDMQRTYNESHKQQMLSTSHEMTAASLRSGLVPETRPFESLPPVQSFQQQENMSDSRPLHLTSRDGHRMDMGDQKPLLSHAPYGTYPGVNVHSKDTHTENRGINGDAPTSPISPVKQKQTFFDTSTPARNDDSNNHSVVNTIHDVSMENHLLGSSPEIDFKRSAAVAPNRYSSNSSQVKFVNKLTNSAIKKQHSAKDAVKFILAGKLEDEEYSSDGNRSSIYSHEMFSKDTRTIAIQTGMEKQGTRTIKQEVDNNWSAADHHEAVDVENQTVNSYHPRGMVPNPDPAAKRVRLEMAYDNPRQLLSPPFKPRAFKMGKTGPGAAAENGVTPSEGRKEASDNDVQQNQLPEPRYGSTQSESFSQMETFSEKVATSEEVNPEQREAIFQATKEKLEMERMEVNIQIDESQCILINDQKRWQCHLCAKNYTTKHNLVTHVLDHNGIKPHLCRVCGKYFKQLSHLNTHMLTHDNVKPHVCTICCKGFTQVSCCICLFWQNMS